jgi:hypothetical protein
MSLHTRRRKPQITQMNADLISESGIRNSEFPPPTRLNDNDTKTPRRILALVVQSEIRVYLRDLRFLGLPSRLLGSS